MPAEELLEAAKATAPVVPPTSGFVVSYTKKGKHRRLHALAACWRLPNVHYREWRAFGELLPAEAEFDSVCSTCLPSGPPALEAPAPSSSDSSSSSSGDEEPEGKKPKLDSD